jgi:hypothetical protein
MAALMGMLTGIDGGMIRDILVNQTPTVLQADLYAVAVLVAGVAVVIGHYPSFAVMIVGAPCASGSQSWPFCVTGAVTIREVSGDIRCGKCTTACFI